jgi:hypothetical protein
MKDRSQQTSSYESEQALLQPGTRTVIAAKLWLKNPGKYLRGGRRGLAIGDYAGQTSRSLRTIFRA